MKKKTDDLTNLLLDATKREAEPRKGAIGSSIARVKAVDQDARTVTAIVSTPNADRYEEIVEPKAFAEWLDVFMANPVFVAGHTYVGWAGEPTVIGHWQSVQITSEGLVATARFAQTKLADEYWQLYRDGHMKAFSVGWITHEWEMREFEVAPGINKKIRVFTEVELIEISAVAIPANRESLVRAASATRAKGDDDQTIKEMICGVVREELKTHLGTDPGGELHMLIEDVVELTVQRLAGQTCSEHDDDTAGASAPGSDHALDDVINQLKQLRDDTKNK